MPTDKPTKSQERFIERIKKHGGIFRDVTGGYYLKNGPWIRPERIDRLMKKNLLISNNDGLFEGMTQSWSAK